MKLPHFSPPLHLNTHLSDLFNVPFIQVVTLTAEYAVAMRVGYDNFIAWRVRKLMEGTAESQIVDSIYPHDVFPGITEHMEWYGAQERAV